VIYLNLKNFKAPNLGNIKQLLNSDLSSLKNIKKAPKLPKIDLNPKPKTTKPVVSIDIGVNKTKVVVGRYAKDKLIIDKTFMVETPDGSIADGNILTPVNLSRVIKKLLTGNGINIKEANITSNGTQIINREIIVPAAEGEELDTLVRYEIQQYLPINMDDYVVQYNILEEFKQEDLTKYRVLVVTYPHRLTKQHYELLTSIGLKANVLDVTFNSINKLFNDVKLINNREYNRSGSNVFIDMGAETLNVNIYNDGKLDFTRIIKSGGHLVDRLIAQKLGIGLVEAERMKVNLGSISEESFLEGTESRLINQVIVEAVDEWVEEIGRILQFYRNKKQGNTVDNLYIHGGSSNLKGMEEYLSKKLNVTVERIESLNNVVLGNSADSAGLNRHLNAIGAIIRL
jgi:type IV pilus assembly protein PilM